MENSIILVLDIFGTMIFAATGAIKAIRKRLDIFGVVVLACCVGVGGGMIRDTIIGALPVSAMQNWNYLCVCIAMGVVAFVTARYWMRFRNLIAIGDAIGLGVFTAIGAAKGIQFDIGFIGIILCGVFTAIGGGIIRDVLTAEIPTVLKTDFYATAALLGGIIYFLLHAAGVYWFVNFVVTAVLVTGIRLLAMHFRVQLPRVRSGKNLFKR